MGSPIYSWKGSSGAYIRIGYVINLLGILWKCVISVRIVDCMGYFWLSIISAIILELCICAWISIRNPGAYRVFLMLYVLMSHWICGYLWASLSFWDLHGDSQISLDAAYLDYGTFNYTPLMSSWYRWVFKCIGLQHGRANTIAIYSHIIDKTGGGRPTCVVNNIRIYRQGMAFPCWALEARILWNKYVYREHMTPHEFDLAGALVGESILVWCIQCIMLHNRTIK